MKIIKSVGLDWHPQYTCSACDTVLELDASDLKCIHYNGDYRDPPYDEFYVNCSVCKSKIVIMTNTIPKLIRMKISKNK